MIFSTVDEAWLEAHSSTRCSLAKFFSVSAGTLNIICRGECIQRDRHTSPSSFEVHRARKYEALTYRGTYVESGECRSASWGWPRRAGGFVESWQVQILLVDCFFVVLHRKSKPTDGTGSLSIQLGTKIIELWYLAERLVREDICFKAVPKFWPR